MNDFSNLKEVVKRAGERASELFGHAILKKLKANDDLVTNADLEVEQIIFQYIKQEFPSHGLDSEESEIYQPNAEYMWILDPIDGTKYFNQNIPLYSISLALEFKQKLVLGLIYIPETKELFYASSIEESVAERNDSPISCSANKPLEELTLIMELPNRNDPDNSIDKALAIMSALMKKVKRVRIFGVGAISLCYCAIGGFDAYINLNTNRKEYDYAAGKVILRESGGEIIENDNLLIGGNKEIITNILNFLQQNGLMSL